MPDPVRCHQGESHVRFAQKLPLAFGNSTSRIQSSVPNTNMFQLYTESKATSGDNRGIYNRFYISGAGGNGESLRTYTTVNNVVADTVHGAHTSLSFGTSGRVTGQGVAGRNTLHIPSGGLAAGTYAALQAEVYADGTGVAASALSLFRAVVGGNSTGAASVLTFLDLSAAAGSGKLIDTDKTALTGKAGLLVTVNGAAYGYIPIVTGA